MIDPWGIKNISMYTNGLCKSLSVYTDLTLVTNYYYKNTTEAQYNIKPIFFKLSENMGNIKLRKIIRGIEYIHSYHKIIKELKKHKYHVVHIQWLLHYKIDIIFLKWIKKYCNKIVYTAHNVIPHVNGDKYIADLKTIYNTVDNIVLHGEGIRAEFRNLFSEYDDKIIIQRFGTNINQITDYEIKDIDKNIVEKINNYDKIFIFAGIMYYNKGVHRLLDIWLEKFSDSNHLLIVAGQKKTRYKELDELEDRIRTCDNILYINSYVEDNLLSYLFNKSDLVVLPYYHASMSAVVFTAAEFKKPVLCTNVGSLNEYIIEDENSFIVESDNRQIYEKIRYISDEISKKELVEMGNKLNDYININYSWNIIGKKLVIDCYEV